MRRKGTLQVLTIGLGVLAVGLLSAIVLLLSPTKTLPAKVVAVAAGGNHTCVIRPSGGVECWGDNGNGQLGNGTSAPGGRSPSPVDVVGLEGEALAVAAGHDHTCALVKGGKVQCWGFNASGQLGDGDMGGIRSTPVDAKLDGEAAAVTTMFWHTCALMVAGDLKCWGSNEFGQLGDGTTVGQGGPVEVEGLDARAVAVTTGQQHTCALTTTGRVKCWGSNHSGQLGDGTTNDSLTPVDVQGLPQDVTAIAAGYSSTCVLTESGGVACWGLTHERELDLTFTQPFPSSTTPVNILGLETGAVAIGAGVYHTCALTEAAGVKCWGTDADGQQGDGDIDIPPPTGSTVVDVKGLTSGVQAIGVGAGHTCALTTAGNVKCWGIGFGWTPVDIPLE